MTALRDCWRQCIARLAGVDWELVPDFVGDDPDHWMIDTCQWLEVRGLMLVAMVPVRGQQIVVAALCQPRPPYIAVGRTQAGHYHAVAFDADGSLWDPQEGGQGLASIMGVYWVASG